MSLDLTDFQNKKYTTRDGRPVRLLCVDAVGAWPIIGTLSDREEGGRPREYPYVWDAKGCRGSLEGDDDLINAKTKKEGWVAIIETKYGAIYACGPYLGNRESVMSTIVGNGYTVLSLKLHEWEG